jgi:uncharacterized membrane protein YccC
MPDLEMAFKVVDRAWSNSTEEIAQVEIPPALHHLSRDQWEIICEMLAEMQYQLNRAQVH